MRNLEARELTDYHAALEFASDKDMQQKILVGPTDTKVSPNAAIALYPHKPLLTICTPGASRTSLKYCSRLLNISPDSIADHPTNPLSVIYSTSRSTLVGYPDVAVIFGWTVDEQESIRLVCMPGESPRQALIRIQNFVRENAISRW